MTIVNSTIAGNSGVNGGGLRTLATTNLQNTIIADNTATTSGPDWTGNPTSLGNNLVEDTTGCAYVAGAGDITGDDPLLGALASNGGSTQTRALTTGSPAIDAGSNAACAAAPVSGVDQRGTVRPQGATCDIGAYEAASTAGGSAPPSLPPSVTHTFPGLGPIIMGPWVTRTLPPGPSMLLVQRPLGPITFDLGEAWSGASVTAGPVATDGLEMPFGDPGLPPPPLFAFALTGTLPVPTPPVGFSFEYLLPPAVPPSDLALGYWDGEVWLPLPMPLPLPVPPGGPGVGARVIVTGSMPGPGVVALFDAPSIALPLIVGVNAVVWPGGVTTPAAIIEGDDSGEIVAIFAQDPLTGLWLSHTVGVPDFVSSLAAITPDQVLIIRTDASVTWVQPPW